MNAAATRLDSESAKELIKIMFSGINEGMRRAVSLFWELIESFLLNHWLWIMAALFALMAVALTKAMMGRWGVLGSLIYNLLYFGTLLVIVVIFGPELFINNWFQVFLIIILYPACYLITGFILDKIRVIKF